MTSNGTCEITVWNFWHILVKAKFVAKKLTYRMSRQFELSEE